MVTPNSRPKPSAFPEHKCSIHPVEVPVEYTSLWLELAQAAVRYAQDFHAQNV